MVLEQWLAPKVNLVMLKRCYQIAISVQGEKQSVCGENKDNNHNALGPGLLEPAHIS